MTGRVLGDVGHADAGPTVVALGALHGDEPAGIEATRQVLDALSGATIAGRVVGVVGNVRARAARQRYLVRDLNRGWSPASCASVRAASHDTCPEDAEQRELLQCLESLADQATGPLLVLDLHSTSGDSVPFCTAPDLPAHHDLAVALPIPFVAGLAEAIDGPLLAYLGGFGHAGLAIEGGPHDDPATASLLTAAIWFSLVSARVVEPGAVPDLPAQARSLAAAAHGKPTVVRVVHRHGCVDGDGFAMRPGFATFDPVRAGQPLATDANGPIESHRDGLVVLPRYGERGSDGFFLAVAEEPEWSRVSAAARLAKALFDAG